MLVRACVCATHRRPCATGTCMCGLACHAHCRGLTIKRKSLHLLSPRIQEATLRPSHTTVPCICNSLQPHGSVAGPQVGRSLLQVMCAGQLKRCLVVALRTHDTTQPADTTRHDTTRVSCRLMQSQWAHAEGLRRGRLPSAAAGAGAAASSLRLRGGRLIHVSRIY